jgi:probable phosphoglycerate mutase
VLVRHGEAVCNVNGVVGGMLGCTGLTDRGVAQAEALRDRLRHTAELGPVDALYASTLPRAVQTAEIVAPALATPDGNAPAIVRDADLCELRPGEADGMTWTEFAERFPEPDWDRSPDDPLARGAESWSGFVTRAVGALRRLVGAPSGEGTRTIVCVCHAGIVEASLLGLLPVGPGRVRLGLRTAHASLTEWHVEDGVWRLQRFNDATAPGGAAQQA